jgi:hypothetical protein
MNGSARRLGTFQRLKLVGVRRFKLNTELARYLREQPVAHGQPVSPAPSLPSYHAPRWRVRHRLGGAGVAELVAADVGADWGLRRRTGKLALLAYDPAGVPTDGGGNAIRFPLVKEIERLLKDVASSWLESALTLLHDLELRKPLADRSTRPMRA